MDTNHFEHANYLQFICDLGQNIFCHVCAVELTATATHHKRVQCDIGDSELLAKLISALNSEKLKTLALKGELMAVRHVHGLPSYDDADADRHAVSTSSSTEQSLKTNIRILLRKTRTNNALQV